MKRTVEIDDTIEERVESACSDVEDDLRRYLDANPEDYEDEGSDVPCLSNDLDYSGAIHEIIDGSVPIYTKEIKDTWYLRSDQLDQAYEDAGIGDNTRENNGMVAIYCYIEQAVACWYQDNAAAIVDDWRDKRKSEAESGS